MRILIVTRHPALVQVLAGLGITGRVIAHVTPADVTGMDVYGVLPYRLAALASSFTEITLDLPPELRGVELSAEQIRAHMGALTTYTVTSR